MKPSRQPAFSRLAATLAAVVLGLGMPAFSSVAAATPSNYTASVIDGAIPATLDGITLTQAPSFGGADNGVEESRSTIATYLGAIALNHVGYIYGSAGGADLCFTGCEGFDKTTSLTFTLPTGTTAFAVRLNAQGFGATTYTISGPGNSSAAYTWGGTGEGSQPTLAVSASNGSTLGSVTITATQADGCTWGSFPFNNEPCSINGLIVVDAAIGDGVVGTTTTTEPEPTDYLASTGSNSSNVLVVGSTMVFLGAVSMLVTRRRTHRVR